MGKIYYKKLPIWKYVLAEDYKITLPQSFHFSEGIFAPYYQLEGHILTIREGYAWDGPSGLSIDTKNFMRGSLIHDCLYQMMNEGQLDKSYRKIADKLLRRFCREDGMSKFRAWYVYHAVRKLYPIWSKFNKDPDMDRVYVSP